MTFPPEWHTLGREAELAAEQLAIGVTALGRANHSQNGLYHQAFFALSIGFERLAKLILVANYAVENKGEWMTDQALKSIGHDISALLDACEPISAKHLSDTERPNDPVHRGIVRTLSGFALLTRYYNLASLSGGKAASREPIQAWLSDVGMPILDRHYNANQRADRGLYRRSLSRRERDNRKRQYKMRRRVALAPHPRSEALSCGLRPCREGRLRLG